MWTLHSRVFSRTAWTTDIKVENSQELHKITTGNKIKKKIFNIANRYGIKKKKMVLMGLNLIMIFVISNIILTWSKKT